MFDFTDKRTSQERVRDMERAEQREHEAKLALSFLNLIRQRLNQEDGLGCGLVGRGSYGGSELLIESAGITYKLKAEVDQA